MGVYNQDEDVAARRARWHEWWSVLRWIVLLTGLLATLVESVQERDVTSCALLVVALVAAGSLLLERVRW